MQNQNKTQRSNQMMMAETGDQFTISGDVSPSSSAFEYIENYQQNSGGPGDDLEKSRFLNKDLAKDIADLVGTPVFVYDEKTFVS